MVLKRSLLENCNLLDSNIVDISGALFILRIQYGLTQIQCEEGTRDFNNIWVPVVSFFVSGNIFLISNVSNWLTYQKSAFLMNY